MDSHKRKSIEEDEVCSMSENESLPKRPKTGSSENNSGSINHYNGTGCGDINETLETESTQATQQYSLSINGDDWMDDGYFDKVMNKSISGDGDVKCSQKSSNSSLIASRDDHNSLKCAPEAMESQILPYPATVSIESDPCQSANGNLKKIGSVQKDADTIANMLDMKDTQTIYNRLLQKRRISNRMEVVMDEILEGGIEKLREKYTKDDEEAKNSAEFDQIFLDVEEVIQIIKSKNASIPCDPNNVYSVLEKISDTSNRVHDAVEYLLGGNISLASGSIKNISSLATEGSNEETKLIEDINKVLKKVKNADPNVVHSLLVENADDDDRINCVIGLLADEDGENCHERSTRLSETSNEDRAERTDGDSSDNSQYRNDPVYRDMKIISKMFPDKDRNEIYAYLEAHFDKTNRIQIVTEELLGMNENSQESQSLNKHYKSTPAESSDSQSVPIQTQMSVTIQTQMTGPSETEKEVSVLMAIFPDCDPNYLYAKLEEMSTVPARVEQLSASLLENRNYPKLKDVLDKEQTVSQRTRLQKLEMSPAEFLELFPEPEKRFLDEDKPVTDSYKSHAMIHLRNTFPMLHVKYINKKFTEHKEHLTPSALALQSLADEFSRNPRKADRMKRFRKTLRPSDEPMPEKADEIFYRELYYLRERDNIQEFIQRQIEEKAARLQLARENGDLNECVCCYDNECLFEDMGSCPEGHLFCKECIRRSSEEIIGQAKVSFPCLAGDCPTEFTMRTLQDVLSSNMFSLLLRKIQEEEIRKADITDLVSCPFCSFATIISNPEDKVFKCMNPECLKESCRFCKEPNHIPLRCEEVEKQGETSMRAFIENKITEAMVRTCWKCKKRFYKTEGCNKMTCTCGASMCYICRKPVKDYSHFGRGGCAQDTNVFKLHQIEMEKAAKEAKEKYEEEHPELKGTTLKYDPVKHIKDLKKVQGVGAAMEIYDEDGEDDDDDEEPYEEEEDVYDDDNESDDEDMDDIEDDPEYMQAVLEYNQLNAYQH